MREVGEDVKTLTRTARMEKKAMAAEAKMLRARAMGQVGLGLTTTMLQSMQALSTYKGGRTFSPGG